MTKQALTDYAVAPGEYLEEWMVENSVNGAEVSRRTGFSVAHVRSVLRGEDPVRANFALALERVTGIPARSWLALEQLYGDDLARLNLRRGVRRV